MFLLLLLLGVLPAFGQANCASGAIPVFSTCELSFDLTPADDPGKADVRAEFRSPKHKTYLIHAFIEGPRAIFRFAPTEAGVWDYQISSNVTRLEGKIGQVMAATSEAPGFVHVANVHHFITDDFADARQRPHLWMGSKLENFAAMPRADFDRAIEQRAQEKYTHLRVTLEKGTDVREAAERVRAINAKGMIADLALAAIPSDAAQRERYVQDIVARFSAFDVTWTVAPPFENVLHGRTIAKETGTLIQKLDPYDHPCMSMAISTSGPMAGDGWTSILNYGTVDANVGAVEHQFYQLPAINTGIQTQQDLWNATMNGQYPASGSGPAMKVWADFMAQSRYWELEPYFDVDGGRAVALEGVEYLVYVEKPTLVELTVENHGYDVVWMNPATGETVKQKDYKGEHFTGEPPDKSHDWVLRVSREGRKEGMLKSYKFESRTVPVQEIEQNPARIPFEIVAPAAQEISLSHPAAFGIKVKRDTRGTRSLLVSWTAEVPLDGEGYRVVGTGREGTLKIPQSIADQYPAVVSLRAMVLNANGKAYTLDKVYRLVP
jgi:hypothetical protein